MLFTRRSSHEVHESLRASTHTSDLPHQFFFTTNKRKSLLEGKKIPKNAASVIFAALGDSFASFLFFSHDCSGSRGVIRDSQFPTAKSWFYNKPNKYMFKGIQSREEKNDKTNHFEIKDYYFHTIIYVSA